MRTASARLADGVLTLTVPKTAPSGNSAGRSRRSDGTGARADARARSALLLGALPSRAITRLHLLLQRQDPLDPGRGNPFVGQFEDV